MAENQYPLVSVVIPVYNVEPWLRECLDSVINQTLRDIEIICVNDGSTDGSPGILHEYAEKDDRIRMIDQENKGLSEARNAGAQIATGKYLYFMDSDDILISNALELCAENMILRNLDLLNFNFLVFGDDPQSARIAGEMNGNYTRHLNEETIYTGQELFSELTQKKKLFVPVWSYMISRSAFISYNCMFHPNILHEDEPWTFYVLLNISRCGCLNKTLYMRRIRSGSITQMSPTFDHAYGKFAGFVDIQQMVWEQRDLLHNNPYLNACIWHTVNWLKDTISTYRICDEAEKQKRHNLPFYDQLLFEQNIVFPASLEDRIVQQQIENHYLQDKIHQQKQMHEGEVQALKEEVQALKKEVQALRNSVSYRLGRKLTFLPGKVKRFIRNMK